MQIEDCILYLNNIKAENEQLKERLKAIDIDSFESLKQENARLSDLIHELSGEFMAMTNIQDENVRLKEIIKSLRQQLESYRKHSRKQYDIDRDYLPYHEREE